ncbi:LD-carboxypeptidase [Clostridium sp. MSJ-4]|uniref:LD-carboxypeptidase n=1 Tax=Clostridium simiarum TaxID=2841506 RepID=A0ABS6F7K5_9CLOT|nr:S66 peptidase family protein [Clostridium simiarum]MBU5593512.1 LD-carboxypeptidase [Clostridium simiarum]
MIKPKALKEGDRIAVLSPSNGLPFLFPGIYEMGIKNLEEVLGFEVVEMPTARMSPEELYKNPKLRAEDLNRAFSDDSINGIITSIGGYESVRILKYLDKESILKNPKFIMGFSDSTTFLSYLNYMGMVTFYGPSIMAGLAQIKHLPLQFEEHLRSMLFGREFPYNYKPYERWTNAYKNWGDKSTLGQCEEFYNNEYGWDFIQGEGIAEGKLWGGCIEVLEFLKSTEYWPCSNFWQDKILFFETSEEKPSPHNVGYMLRNYGVQGIFEKAKGIIFGRPKDYSDKERAELKEIIQRVVREEFHNTNIPIVLDVDFGHTDPKMILPLGCKISLDSNKKEIKLIESPFI